MAPVIDKRFLPDRFGKARKRSSKVLIFAMVLVALLMLGAIAGFMAQTVKNGGPHPSEAPARALAETYTTHSPISINGNAGFTNVSGVTWGSGTSSDPYIIADWDIDASTASGIYINDTNAHFIIRDCTVHDGGSAFIGIFLNNAANGNLMDNNCSNDIHGIYLGSSSNNTVSNNICNSNYEVGIWLVSSSNDTLCNNSCSNNEWGMYLLLARNSTVIGNTCSNNEWGIYLDSSKSITLNSNNYSSNNCYGIWFALSSNNTLTNNNCSSNDQMGMMLFSSDNNILRNNTCDSNNASIGGYGIELDSSSNSVVSNNTCLNNQEGIGLDLSSNNTVSDNTLIGDGIVIGGSSISQWNTHSIDTSNTVNGKPVYYYKNQNGVTVPAGAGQVILANCTHSIVENQNLSDSSVGIELAFSSGIAIIHNTCMNDLVVISLDISNNCTMSGNTCSNNDYGISIASSNNNILINNTCSSNDQSSIELFSSSNNTLTNNNCSSNGGEGIYLGQFPLPFPLSSNTPSNDNEVSSNLVCNNAGYGVDISSGSNNRVWNNIFVGNNGATDTYNASHVQACDNGTNNCWSTSGSPHGYGNYWSDWTTPDANHDGIVDLPYNIAGSAGAKDYYPLTTVQTQIPEFGMMPFVVLALMGLTLIAGETRRKKESWP